MKNAFVIFILVVIIYGCESSTESEYNPVLVQVSNILLTIDEPSGIAIDSTGKNLWVAGGRAQKVYQINTSGEIVTTLSYEGDDIEGIYYQEADSSLWVVEEKLRKLVKIDLEGNVLATYTLSFAGDENHGFEGITKNGAGNFVIINEQNPTAMLTLNSDFSVASIDTLTLTEDLSDVTYSTEQDCYVFVSDESKVVFWWSATKGVIKKFTVPFDKYEGIALDEKNSLLYIVNDELNTMTVYKVE